MTKVKDYASIVSKMSVEKRDAILVMGENEDTTDGFEVRPRVMQELVMQELVNVEDEVENPLFWTYRLNRDGIGCWGIITAMNRNLQTGTKTQL